MRTLSEKYDRKRAHRIKDAIAFPTKHSAKFYQRHANKTTRSVNRQNIHRFLKNEYNDELDFNYETQSFAWHCDRAGYYVHYGNEASWYRKSRQNVKATQEDIKKLPKWMRHQILDNIKNAKNNLHYVRRPYSIPRELVTINQLTNIVINYVQKKGLHKLNETILSKHIHYYHMKDDNYIPVGPSIGLTLKCLDEARFWLERLIKASKKEGNPKQPCYVICPSSYYYGGRYTYTINCFPAYHPEWLEAVMTILREYTRKNLILKS